MNKLTTRLIAYVAANPATTSVELGERFGLTPELAHLRLKRAGFTPAPRKRGRPKLHDEAFITRLVRYATEHPAATTRDLSTALSVSTTTTTRSLRAAGHHLLHRGGSHPKPQPNQSALQVHWEKELHNLGLGLHRGTSIGRFKIQYVGDAEILSVIGTTEAIDRSGVCPD